MAGWGVSCYKLPGQLQTFHVRHAKEKFMDQESGFTTDWPSEQNCFEKFSSTPLNSGTDSYSLSMHVLHTG